MGYARRGAAAVTLALLLAGAAVIAGPGPACASRDGADPDSTQVIAPAAAPDSTEAAAPAAVPDSSAAGAAAADSLEEAGIESARAALHDTLGVRFEAGASSDVSTEQYFEDTFLDSVALGLRQVSAPETRYAAVAHVSAAGTRGGRSSAFSLDNELSWGDLVRQDLCLLDWRSSGPAAWTWALTPRAEYRHDRTFGRDLEQGRVAASGRLRRSLPGHESAAELSAQGEWFRTRGTGADLVPDRNAGGMMLRLQHAPANGSEWQLGYGALARIFPDTLARDHLEQRAEAEWSADFAGAHRVELSAELARRYTLHPAPTSQDRFLEGELTGLLELALGGEWGASLRGHAERLRYDARDTTVFFDYDLARVEFEPRWSDGSWTCRAGPRAEWLLSRSDPEEEYVETGGALEVEWLRRGWWSLAPAAGWREYATALAPAPAAGALPVASSRTSFAFAQLDAMGDQSLAAGIRLRLFASGRIERHADRAQDARSLYISLDVRRLF